LALDLSKLRQEVGQSGPDFTKPSAGGGDFDPPAIGPTRMRLVGYVETGVHTVNRGGQKKTQPRVELTFELSGPKHEPKKLDDGRVIPFRVKVKEMLSTSERANLVKLFNLMNLDGNAKNFLDMLVDKGWRGTISHYKFKTPQGQERVIPQLRGKGTGFQIFPVEFEDPETGELRRADPAPAVSEPMVFLWDYADVSQWDSLNDFVKDTIRKAENFVGSPIYLALAEAGRTDEYAVSERGTAQDAAEEEAEAAEVPTEDKSEALKAALAEVEKQFGKGATKAAPATAKATKPAGGTKATAKPKTAPAADNDDPLAGV
jgi:hypothetical protein